MVLQWCRNLPTGHCVKLCWLFKGCRNLSAGHFVKWCRLLKRCRNLPAGHCVAGVQTVKVVLESTCQQLCYRVADCLSGVRTYLPGTVLQSCRLLKWCQNLLVGHCVTVVQTVKEMPEPTCRALFNSCSDCLSGVGTFLPGTVLQPADCLSSVRTYLLGTVLQWCRLFKQCQNIPAAHCVTVVQTV